MLIKKSKVAQLFLYLTLIVASSVTMGEAQNPNAENSFKQCASSVGQDLSDKNIDSDSFDDFLFKHVSLASKCANHTEQPRSIYISTYTTVGNFSIRAPPILLS